jgi:hypothetical protein
MINHLYAMLRVNLELNAKFLKLYFLEGLFTLFLRPSYKTSWVQGQLLRGIRDSVEAGAFSGKAR